MRTLRYVSLIAAGLICGAGAQNLQKPALKQGVSVSMPVGGHAVEMPAADEPSATVVAITAAGKIFVGIKATEPAALSNLREATVYVKADSRVPYQRVLTVLDALRGKSVVLLTEPPEDHPVRQGIVPPYGMKLVVSR